LTSYRINELRHSYSRLCDVTRKVNDMFGIQILMNLTAMNCFIQFNIYDVINHLFNLMFHIPRKSSLLDTNQNYFWIPYEVIKICVYFWETTFLLNEVKYLFS
jgi:hypothetical protein